MHILVCGLNFGLNFSESFVHRTFFFTSIARSLRTSYEMVAVALRSLRQILAPVLKTSVTVRFGGTCIQSQRFKQDKHRDTTDWRMRNETARQSRWASFKVRGMGRRQREREHYRLHTWYRAGCGSFSHNCRGLWEWEGSGV